MDGKSTLQKIKNTTDARHRARVMEMVIHWMGTTPVSFEICSLFSFDTLKGKIISPTSLSKICLVNYLLIQLGVYFAFT